MTKKEKAEFIEKLWVIWHCRLRCHGSRPKPMKKLWMAITALFSGKDCWGWAKSYWVMFKRELSARIKYDVFTYMPIGCKGDMAGHSRGYRFCYAWTTKLCDKMEYYWRGVLDQ